MTLPAHRNGRDSRRRRTNDIHSNKSRVVYGLDRSFLKTTDRDPLVLHEFTPLRLRKCPVSWAEGSNVRRHPSAGLAGKFQREATLPTGRCRDGRFFRSDSEEQTGLACWELQTSLCRTRIRIQTGLRSPYSSFHPDQRVRLPLRFLWLR